ncbi:alpha/beta hydrolase (plasmid) [Paraburkholderia pallida]|uniref:Alpha/beta hydrolase n=2 Tax=Paraburkholderia pallida TaxID=2547399 RepID=A0A4P7DAI3_9BURK|nr:alpha/beta hydrolase [Paraburkholderia pallida]
MNEVRDAFCDVRTGVRMCYRTYGPDSGEPLLLIAGLSLQLTSWPASLTDGLVQRGFRVIVFDNRDVGRSSRISQPPPGMIRQMLRRPIPSAYDLEDMAADTIGLLDYLHVARAHIVGMSMGGMIGQIMAATHPQRTVSLTSIFSTTGARKVGQPALSSLSMLTRPPAHTRDEAVQRYSEIMAHIGTQTYPVNDAARRAYAADAWDRGQQARDHEGMARQIGAIIKSGDRTAAIRRIQVPTLVVHGDRDLMVAPSGGVATAAAIAGAEMVTIRGMGHDIPDGVVPLLTDLIDGHARRSVARSPAELASVGRHSA